MKIVVVCENRTQFNDYVDAMLKNLDSLNLVKKYITCGKVTVEELEFTYCRNPVVIRGREFSEGDKLVRVGTWYNIPTKTLEEIETQFATRFKK